MLSIFSPAPVFSGAWDHRPLISSPLSSPPLRASSPLSQLDANACSSQQNRQVQSSPLQAPKFKYASRPARPNPVMRRREEAQESRRKNFLQSVRQKSEDKAWQRRDIEGQFLKTSWLDNVAHLSHDAPDFSETDIEDAMAFQQEMIQSQDDESMVMDDIPEEEEDLEAMFASYQEQQSQPPQSDSPIMSDDEYDDIFAELVSQEQQRQQQYSETSASLDQLSHMQDVSDQMDI